MTLVSTKNLGLIKAIHVGITPPLNTKIIWFDDNVGVKYHKYYDILSTSWIPLASSIDSLSDLDDVTITNPIDGQVLMFSNGDWINSSIISYSKELVSGGAVWSGSGYIYDVSTLGYYFYNPLAYTVPVQVTLSNGDPTNDRIDAIVIDVTGAVLVIEGTPSPTPSTPDVSEYILVQYIIVPSGSTEPDDDLTDIYQDNNEWILSEINLSGASGTIDPNSTDSPQSGTKLIKSVTNPKKYFTLTSDIGLIQASDYQSVSLYVRFPQQIAVNKFLSLTFRQGSTVKGIAVSLFSLGLSRTTLNTWQQIVVPISTFSLGTNQVDNLVFRLYGGADVELEWCIDNVRLVSNTIAPPQDQSKIDILVNNSTVGEQSSLNLIEGNGISLTGTNDILNERVDVIIEIDPIYLATLFLPLTGGTLSGSLTLPKVIIGSDLGAQINIVSSGQFGNHIGFMDTNPGSYIGFNWTTDQGLASQFLVTGSTFVSAAFKSNRSVLANYGDGLQFFAGAVGADIEFYTGGFAPANLRLRLDATGGAQFLDPLSNKLLELSNDGLLTVGRKFEILRTGFGIPAFTIDIDNAENTLLSTTNADLIFMTKSSGSVETARFTNSGVFKMSDDTKFILGAYDTVLSADMYGYVSVSGNTSNTVGLKFEVTQIGNNTGLTALTFNAGGHGYFGLNNVYTAAVTVSILQDSTYGLYINDDNTGLGGLLFSGKAAWNGIYSNQAVPFHLFMNTAEAISMVGSNVGIYKNNPSERLDVFGGNARVNSTTDNLTGLLLENMDAGTAAAIGIKFTSASGTNGYIYLTGPNYAAAPANTLIIQNAANDIYFYSASAFPVMKINQTKIETEQELLVNHNFRALYEEITTTQALGKGYTFNCYNTITVTLPDAATSPGRILVVKNFDTGIITINTTSSQTIDGLTTKQLTAQYDKFVFQSNGSNWIIL